jgi:FMN phosphatase YigB (HAD superfamily)
MISLRRTSPAPERVVAACRRDMDACKRAIDRAELVSFGLFDTLLCRLVPAPQDLFFVLGARIQNVLGISPLSFLRLRKRAESALRERYLGELGHSEVTLREIYESLSGDVRFELCHAAPEHLTWEAEWSLEKLLVKAHPIGLDLLKHAQAAGKRVVFTSDTYFEEWQIRELLDAAGVPVAGDLFISCERKKTKRGGGLFEELLASAGVAAGRVIHIGDRADSDVAVPASLGMRTWRMPLLYDLLRESGLLEASGACERRSPGDMLLLGCLARSFGGRVLDGPETWRNEAARLAGYFSFGPLLLGFTCWLAASFRRHQPAKVLFLAREGRIFMQAFERLGFGSPAGGPHPADYLLVSRVAARKACLSIGSPAPLFEHFEMMASAFGNRGRRHGEEEKQERNSFLKGMGLGTGCVLQLAKDLDPDGSGPSVRELLPGVERLVAEGKAYREYLGSMLPPAGSGSVALVDLGWKGTITASLRMLIPATTRVDAYLVASSVKASHSRSEGYALMGYLCENGWPANTCRHLRANAEVLETVFSTTEGSLWGMRRKGDEFEPIHDPRDESPNRSAFIIAAQNGMMRLVEDMRPLIELVPEFAVLPDLAADTTLRFLERPTRAEVDALDKILMTSAGLDSELNLEMAPEVTLGQILQSPRQQLARVRNCYWHAGFKIRTRFMTRCCLALIEVLASVFATGRKALMRRRRLWKFLQRRDEAKVQRKSLGEIA